MSDAASGLLVVHTGALGDSVLIWPLLRALLAGRDRPVRLVGAASKAALARRVLGGQLAIDNAESPEWWSLWRFGPQRSQPNPAVGCVLTNLLGPEVDDSAAQRTWRVGAQARFPRAEIVPLGYPGDPQRAAVWRRWRVAESGAVERRHNPHGPIVIHAGAGGPAKTLPLSFWADVAEHLPRSGLPRIAFIGGEVERARFTPHDHAAFDRLGGRWLDSLDELHDALAVARLFIGADTGPTHLAAQLGVPTLAVFGPSDPAVWSPVGAPGAVRIVQAPGGLLAGLPPARVVRAAEELLG